MNEIFGASNFRSSIIVRRGAKNLQNQFKTIDRLGSGYESVLMYTKSASYRFPPIERYLEETRLGNWNNHWRGTDRPTMRYPLFDITPDSGQWRWSQVRSKKAICNYERLLNDLDRSHETVNQDEIDNWYLTQEDEPDLLRLSKSHKPEHYIPPAESRLVNDIWFDLVPNGSRILGALFNQQKLFDNPKSLGLLQRCLSLLSQDDIILDFFSGSSTTAHAVMQLNAEDGGNRRFIMVQLPQEVNEKSEAFKAGYKTIAEIGKERIRRAGQNILQNLVSGGGNKAGSGGDDLPLLDSGASNDGGDHYPPLDIGFRTFKIDSTCMADVYYNPDDTKQDQLGELVGNIKPGRTDEDLLFQIMVDWGLDLSLPLERRNMAGTDVLVVDGNALAVCFAEKINEELVKQLAGHQPPFLRVVFKDSSFPSDDIKINFSQIFKQLSPATEIKVI